MLYDINDKMGIENHGKEEWERICAHENDKERREEKIFAEVTKKESFDELFKLIDDLIGEHIEFKYSVNERKHCIDIESEDLIGKESSKFMRLAWKEFHIANFSGGVSASDPYYMEDRDYSKPCESVMYWMTIVFSYTHHDGGHNSATIADAMFDETGKWTLEAKKEKSAA